MNKASLIFLLLCSIFSFGQNPLVKIWDKDFGGTNGDYFYSIQQTFDGGFIIGGYSNSGISGDKTTTNWGLRDYWIIKTDSFGNKQWDKDFGGTSMDYYSNIQQTSDRGYILSGFSGSHISGDKTQPCWGGSGDEDYWIVKIDSLGNKQWDKDFGGTSLDWCMCIRQTSDKGYILGGYSRSGISGDKTQPCWGVSGDWDYWIVKTDSLGNKQWDKDFGGTDDDNLQIVLQTTDGGYILGGSSESGISGDKTQQCWGGTGDIDYWIIKIDSFGNKQWDKDLGGTGPEFLNTVLQTADGGFIVGGSSISGISGDKSQPVWGSSDYWIVKIDSLGNKLWDRDFGGAGTEEQMSIQQTSDGGYIISGDSYSNMSGDKSQNNMGMEQGWFVKTDSLGNKLWDKTLLTSGHDESSSAIQTIDGCYVMGISSSGGISGDKSQNTWGDYDFWILKLCESLQAGFTTTSFICPGTCVDFANLSFNATNYQWFFPGASPNSSIDSNPTNICYANPGSYDVQLIASNSTGSDTLLLSNYITVYPFPSSQSITQTADTLIALPGSSTYQWYFNTNLISGATNYFYVATQSGNYNIVATDSNGCEVEAVINNVIADLPLASGFLPFRIYPNPVSESLSVISSSLTGTASTISIYNTLGVLAVQPLTTNLKPETSIDCRQLAPGIYWLEIISGDKSVRTKFVKQ